MIRKLGKIALAAIAASMVISSTAFAAVIYAPGVSNPNAGTDSQSSASAASIENPAGPGTGAIIAAIKAQSGGGSEGEGVTEDTILNQTPLINAVMIGTDGNAQTPFSTNSGQYNSTTDGFSGLWLCYDKAIGDVYYRVFTNEHGWSQWAMNEMRTTNYGDGSKVTGIQIRTTGYTANNYSIFYRVKLNDGVELGWGQDGLAAGAFGNGKYITGIEIKLFKRGTGSSDNYQQGTAYEGIVPGLEGSPVYSTFDGRSFTGWAYDTSNNKYYFSENKMVTGWQYIDGYKYYFDESGHVVNDLEPIIGLKKGDYKIKINKSMKTLTVYAKDGDNGYIMPVKVILTTVGPDTPVGTFKTYESFRWKYMHDTDEGPLYCQFLLRFNNGFLLHSIIYRGAGDSYHLVADTYNMLGKNSSDGCVRMLSGDAAWVYTNCGKGTEVTIYEDEWVPGPLDRPAIQQAIPRTQNYDPTDPVIIAKNK